MRRINQAGLDLIKEFEGVRNKAYLDPIGKLTVGVGHLVLPEDHIVLGQVISDDLVNELLRKDLIAAQHGVEVGVSPIDVTDNQFAACVSLTFNIGAKAFRDSQLAKAIRANNMAAAADQFLKWNHAGGHVVDGLTRRRKAERALFLTPDDTGNANTEPLDEPAPEPEAPPVTTTVEHHDFVQTIASNDTVKEIAKSGVTSIGTRVSTGLATGGLLSAADAFIQQHYAILIFSGGLILLAVIVVLFILWHKSQQQKLVAQIASDPTRTDVRL